MTHEQILHQLASNEFLNNFGKHSTYAPNNIGSSNNSLSHMQDSVLSLSHPRSLHSPSPSQDGFQSKSRYVSSISTPWMKMNNNRNQSTLSSNSSRDFYQPTMVAVGQNHDFSMPPSLSTSNSMHMRPSISNNSHNHTNLSDFSFAPAPIKNSNSFLSQSTNPNSSTVLTSLNLQSHSSLSYQMPNSIPPSWGYDNIANSNGQGSISKHDSSAHSSSPISLPHAVATYPSTKSQTGTENHHNYSLNAIKWFYKDPQGIVQGPFSGANMRMWFENNYFDTSLLIQCSADDAPPGMEFHPLGMWIAANIPTFLNIELEKPSNRNEDDASTGHGRNANLLVDSLIADDEEDEIVDQAKHLSLYSVDHSQPIENHEWEGYSSHSNSIFPFQTTSSSMSHPSLHSVWNPQDTSSFNGLPQNPESFGNEHLASRFPQNQSIDWTANSNFYPFSNNLSDFTSTPDLLTYQSPPHPQLNQELLWSSTNGQMNMPHVESYLKSHQVSHENPAPIAAKTTLSHDHNTVQIPQNSISAHSGPATNTLVNFSSPLNTNSSSYSTNYSGVQSIHLPAETPQSTKVSSNNPSPSSDFEINASEDSMKSVGNGSNISNAQADSMHSLANPPISWSNRVSASNAKTMKNHSPSESQTNPTLPRSEDRTDGSVSSFPSMPSRSTTNSTIHYNNNASGPTQTRASQSIKLITPIMPTFPNSNRKSRTDGSKSKGINGTKGKLAWNLNAGTSSPLLTVDGQASTNSILSVLSTPLPNSKLPSHLQWQNISTPGSSAPIIKIRPKSMQTLPSDIPSAVGSPTLTNSTSLSYQLQSSPILSHQVPTVRILESSGPLYSNTIRYVGSNVTIPSSTKNHPRSRTSGATSAVSVSREKNTDAGIPKRNSSNTGSKPLSSISSLKSSTSSPTLSSISSSASTPLTSNQMTISRSTSNVDNASQGVSNSRPQSPSLLPFESGNLTVQLSPEFEKWCQESLAVLSPGISITFVHYLMTLESDEMIAKCVYAYLGNSAATQEFVLQFVRLKEFESEPIVRSRNVQLISNIPNPITSESSADEQRNRRRRRKAHGA